MRTTKWPITDSNSVFRGDINPNSNRAPGPESVFLNDILFEARKMRPSSSHKHCTSAVLSGAAIIASRWQKVRKVEKAIMTQPQSIAGRLRKKTDDDSYSCDDTR